MRQTILEHARSLLDDEGLAGFSMRKLAARVGVTATALYFHFRDKEEILTALVAAERGILRRQLEEPAGHPDPLTRLRLMYAAAFEFAVRRQDHFRMFAGDGIDWRFPVPDSGRQDPALDPHAFFCHHIQQAIDAGFFDPRWSDPKLIGQMLWAGLHGLISLHATLGHDPWFDWRPLREAVMKLFEIHLSGLVHGPVPGGHDEVSNAYSSVGGTEQSGDSTVRNDSAGIIHADA
ncbi:TetR/AcrR family transcriptional regulator [bacterium]|nr:TetR/AcrR family transcriptional regulator [bacterium]